jgi:hypothetical protein
VNFEQIDALGGASKLVSFVRTNTLGGAKI